MTIGEIIKQLLTAENYAEIRVNYSDEFIDFVKECLPSDYEYLREKEEIYQNVIQILNTFPLEN